MLVALEGLDQSGKETQAKLLRDSFREAGRKARVVSFPDYGTSIGEEIARALQGERDYRPEVMQLLYVANRYERRPDIERWQQAGIALLFDRYIASSLAYGEAEGLDPTWLADLQRFLPQPEVTILLDIAPETAVTRKAVGRDRYEQDLMLQGACQGQLSSAGPAARLVADRWRASEGRCRGGGGRGGRGETFAIVKAYTSHAPAARSTCAHASRVAPVVVTSSARATVLPCRDGGRPEDWAWHDRLERSLDVESPTKCDQSGLRVHGPLAPQRMRDRST